MSYSIFLMPIILCGIRSAPMPLHGGLGCHLDWRLRPPFFSTLCMLCLLFYKFIARSTSPHGDRPPINRLFWLTNLSIILHHCNTLNPATWLPPLLWRRASLCSLWLPDNYRNRLKGMRGSLRHPFDNPNLLLCYDGSCKWNFQGNTIMSYAMVSPHEILEA